MITIVNGATALVLLSLASLPGQGVWPPGFAGKPGSAVRSTPFTISNSVLPAATRMAVVMSAKSLPFAAGAKLRGIAFRRDSVVPVSYRAYTAQALVRIRAVSRAQDVSASTFLVFNQTHVVFQSSIALDAAKPPVGSVPAPFFSKPIIFAKPWRYPGGDLALEMIVKGPRGSVWRCDGVRFGQPAAQRSWPLGSGCNTSLGYSSRLVLEDLDKLQPGGSLALLHDRLRLPPQGLGSLVLLGAVGRPFSLGGLGLDAACYLRVSPILLTLPMSFGDRSSSIARGRLRFAIPASGSLSGVRIAAQGISFDIGLSTRTKMALSQAIEFKVGSNPTSSSKAFIGRTMWKYGSLGVYQNEGLRLGARNQVPVIKFL